MVVEYRNEGGHIVRNRTIPRGGLGPAVLKRGRREAPAGDAARGRQARQTGTGVGQIQGIPNDKRDDVPIGTVGREGVGGQPAISAFPVRRQAMAAIACAQPDNEFVDRPRALEVGAGDRLGRRPKSVATREPAPVAPMKRCNHRTR